ncbi:MAG: co-chaperone GroES [Candidatus Komeilibacteria bacterium CG11_big_fil_rev_8_21_14_0_20_36_20]|uniref:Co-chaperonin GroES n=1 Tax=Candidatus Komeilibacteria bacterium CG11_big_fil_rev_8_21_14_0_20_36_20 TaxID=1974477 RepID=A0A2H0NB83_9BACT|nr:MAG: co-chaperone GroES [Candidatus Komeilibacteria bacterium CG11_big_fil_rev_8_21_14_0_20_36_20]PIR81866.1 MAG: co-chaperone GroES [Candidatus Komeilibacteria bacterium CG10_big_fil_rev_8_21_14_0_10_36_65]PJC55074.1 MAG: co-chaperone GroES [Candidatus Komeilibacteria bacterium CG_4_9_14_0_2_um_filter_36_13]
MKLKPLGDRIVVKPRPKEETTKAGIILPETVNKETKMEGEIVAIGDGEKIKKLNLQVGQKVIYTEYGGSEVKEDGQEYKILSHDDLLAIVE